MSINIMCGEVRYCMLNIQVLMVFVAFSYILLLGISFYIIHQLLVTVLGDEMLQYSAREEQNLEWG